MQISELFAVAAGQVDWMDHLDAAPGVDVNYTALAVDTATTLATVAVSMAAFDPSTVRSFLT